MKSHKHRGDLFRGRPGCCVQDDMYWILKRGGKRGLRKHRRLREKRDLDREIQSL